MNNDQPTVYQDTAANTELHKNEGKKSMISKAIFVVLAFIIVLEVGFGIKTLTQPINVIGAKIPGLSDPQMVLVADKQAYKVGDNVGVIIRESSGGHSILGSDVSLNYDPAYLEATSSANFHKGNIFPNFPIVSIDNTAGTVRVSGISALKTSGFNGAGVFGGLVLTAKKEGNTSITVNFKAGSTMDTTIIDVNSSANILGSVNNLDIVIGSTTQSLSTTATCSERTYKTCTDPLGRIGTQWCTGVNDNPAVCATGCYQDKTGYVPGCKVVVTAPIK